jgi:hypothetical protein
VHSCKYSHEEIADKLERPVSTVHSFLHRSGFRKSQLKPPRVKIVKADLEGIFKPAVGNYIELLQLAMTQAMGNWPEGIGFEIKLDDGKKHLAEVKDGELIRDDGKVMDAYTNGNYTWESPSPVAALPCSD